MKPIEEKVDVNFMQALRCAGYRLPNSYGLKSTGYTYSLGLRYGLLGAAASHHLLLGCDPNEENEALTLIHAWPVMVEEHVRWAVIPRLPFQPQTNLPTLVSRLAYRPLQAYLSLYRRLCPLEQALRIAEEAYVDDHPNSITEGWPFWWKAKAIKAFKEAAEDSRTFALNFFDRREAELDEVPEIALIGE